MWPFKKDAKPELAPYKPSNPRPCWCGSVDFREAQGLGLEKWCADCGTVYMGVGNARNPCGAEDRRKSDSHGGGVMKLARVDNIRQEFPDGTFADRIALVFAHESGPIVKRFAIAASAKTESEELAFMLLKLFTEAWRDLAYRQHGQQWLEKAGKGPTEAEMKEWADQARALRPDLFVASQHAA